MIPLDVIGGACFWGIVLEGSELFMFRLEDELSMVIPEALVWLVVEPFLLCNVDFFVLYGNSFFEKYHPLDQKEC